MNIIKIGGILLTDVLNYPKLINLLNSFETPAFIVFSAIGKTTRLLHTACYAAYDKKLDEALDILEQIKQTHLQISNTIFENDEKIHSKIFDIFTVLDKYIQGIFITREINPKILDKILANGEFLAAILIHNYLVRNGFDVEYLDAKDYIITDSNFGSANPNEVATEYQFRNIQLQKKLYLIAGFYGKNTKNEITTMGYESSNLTATLLASIFKANNIFIISDVDCIHSADPKLIHDTKPIEQLSLSTANKLSNYGLKLIHSKMIDFLRVQNTNLIFTSLDMNKKTIISNKSKDVATPIMVYVDRESHPYPHNYYRFDNFASHIAIGNIKKDLFLKITSLINSLNINFSLTYQNFSDFATFVFDQNLNSEILQKIHNTLVHQ